MDHRTKCRESNLVLLGTDDLNWRSKIGVRACRRYKPSMCSLPSFESVKRFFPVFKRTSEFFRNHEVLEIMPKRANRVIDMGSPPRLPEISISFDEVLASPPESLDAYSTGDTDKSSVSSFENRPFDIQR